jgi:hypothetical protein
LKVDITSLSLPSTARIFVSTNFAYTDPQILLPGFLPPFPDGVTIQQNRSDAPARMEFWINATRFFTMKTLVRRIGCVYSIDLFADYPSALRKSPSPCDSQVRT